MENVLNCLAAKRVLKWLMIGLPLVDVSQSNHVSPAPLIPRAQEGQVAVGVRMANIGVASKHAKIFKNQKFYL